MKDDDQFKENLNFLDSFINPDENLRQLADSLKNYKISFCETLKQVLRKIIHYLCDNYSEKDVFCDEGFYNIIKNLCRYYEIYRKYCCNPCCGPKTPDWDMVVGNFKIINLYLNPDTLRLGDLGIKIPDMPNFEVGEIDVCKNVKAVLKQLIYIICKYREQDLCLDNELTRSLSQLCKVYPEFYTRCCK